MGPLFGLISEQTVLKVAPLADEYKVDTVLRKCEDFLKDICQRACDDKHNTMETSVLVDYVVCAERYRMESVLPLAICLCAERSARLLTEAGLNTMISPETAKLILESRDKMTEEEMKSRLLNGISFLQFYSISFIEIFECFYMYKHRNLNESLQGISIVQRQ
jgi:hypothetical protein